MAKAADTASGCWFSMKWDKESSSKGLVLTRTAFSDMQDV
jgi:hypothetical protein